MGHTHIQALFFLKKGETESRTYTCRCLLQQGCSTTREEAPPAMKTTTPVPATVARDSTRRILARAGVGVCLTVMVVVVLLLGRGPALIFVPRQILRFVRFGLVRRRFAFTDAAAIQSRRGSHRLMCRGLALLWLCIVCGCGW